MELSARSAYRGQVTKITKSARDFLKADSSQLNEENTGRFDEVDEELVSYIQRLTAAHESLRTANQEFQNKCLIKAEDMDKELEKVADYEDSAIGVLARLNSRLHKLRQRQHPGADTVSTGLNNSESRSNTCKNPTKLPKLPLKRFTGIYEEWLPFWEQFRTAVHDNASLTGSEKFNYLESVLEGSAKKTIAGFTPTASCYDAAIALLQEQFGDTEKLIDKHMQQLISLRPVLMKSDATGLRALFNTVMSCTRSLTALKVSSSQYYVMLRSILLRCLPHEMRIDYHRTQESIESKCEREESASDVGSAGLSDIGDSQVRSILSFLRREVESLERAQGGKSKTSSGGKHFMPTTAAGLISVNAKEACLFCKSNEHSTGECNERFIVGQKEHVAKSWKMFSLHALWAYVAEMSKKVGVL